jgi:hypothetical protein
MNSSETFSTNGCGIGCLTILISAIVRAVLNCILIVLLWNWLMTDLFGLSKISLFQAIGIAFLLGLLCSSSSSDNPSGD